MNEGIRIEDLRGIEWAFKGIRGDIIRLLQGSGEPLSFKRICIETAVRPSLCAYHLGLLREKGFVWKEFGPAPARAEHSFYSLTEAGRDLIAAREMISIRSVPAEVPDEIRIIAWKNLPRCFIYPR